MDRESYRFEFIFINNGSSDATLEVLRPEHARDRRVKIINLSWNFGKEHAMAAGFHAASGDAVIPMDVASGPSRAYFLLSAPLGGGL